ncbi:MAG: hypothetical protein E1N59_3016 [Puniceicoccaceae bacterium 5H]|nr:MAG: hypothetical protein E1N59_3016 [Puniceicoccaceae bacterium 5H]
MTSFLRAEFRFLEKPLNGVSRLWLILAVAALVGATVLPLWKIHLVAPQYQEGLQLTVYAWKLVGGNGGQDLVEINNLNHYIGMKAIHAADFIEMKWIPFAFGLFAMLSFRAAVHGKMSQVVDLMALFVYFGLFSMGSFAYRMHQYGHDLDPKAPVTIEPFTPTILGTQQIANFVQTSLPMIGSLFLFAFFACLVLAIWCSRREAA